MQRNTEVQSYKQEGQISMSNHINTSPKFFIGFYKYVHRNWKLTTKLEKAKEKWKAELAQPSHFSPQSSKIVKHKYRT